jgi:precorrin-2/cobalt-factor-2 C20-methyltransferase
MKPGKLYVVGVGPGDPELFTLKAVRILESVPSIVVPRGREEGASLALSIARKVVGLDSKEIMEAHFPMKKTARPEHADALDAEWGKVAGRILARLRDGVDMAFLTLGDPTIYSTFFYLYHRLIESDPDLDIEIIPGVSSINASASRAHIPLSLGDGTIAVIPATYEENLRQVLEGFDTVVLMKVYSVFERVRRALDETGLTAKAVYISRAGMEDEKIVKDITSLKEEDMDYFSLVIVRK